MEKLKILHIASYISIADKKKYSTNLTGYGYMVLDITQNIANQTHITELLLINNFNDEDYLKDVRVINKRVYDIFRYLKFKDIVQGIKKIVSSRISFIKKLKVVFYFATIGYFRHLVKENKYDLIHIHGVGYNTLPFINECIKNMNIKLLITLHGLNSFTDSINITQDEKDTEKEFLLRMNELNLPVAVISSGIKTKILKYLGKSKIDNLRVIPNGCNVNRQVTYTEENLKTKYEIGDKKVILCVGNFSLNKNQHQIFRAFKLLPNNIQDEVCILFLGNTFGDTAHEEYIKSLGLEKSLKLCGNISKDEMGNFYKNADFTIVASIAEGFGLSIIEGYVYGLPNLTFNDLDAVPDVFDPKTMLTLRERTDEALSNGIIELIRRDWDRNYIRNFALNFSLSNMANKYTSFYKEIINAKR